mmetsp:Transcript_34509/g.62059  ORF Transcript_34509/g.62059 Transcript_34509/m.62059 type:complete len:230 (+) Transcript_34509:433-1122(+)
MLSMRSSSRTVRRSFCVGLLRLECGSDCQGAIFTAAVFGVAIAAVVGLFERSISETAATFEGLTLLLLLLPPLSVEPTGQSILDAEKESKGSSSSAFVSAFQTFHFFLLMLSSYTVCGLSPWELDTILAFDFQGGRALVRSGRTLVRSSFHSCHAPSSSSQLSQSLQEFADDCVPSSLPSRFLKRVFNPCLFRLIWLSQVLTCQDTTGETKCHSWASKRHYTWEEVWPA